MPESMKTIMATTARNEDRIILSAHVISELLEKQPRLPVKINFYGEAIGFTKKFYTKELATVVCEIELYDDTRYGGPRNVLDVYPSFKVLEEKLEDRMRIIMDAEFLELSICPMPADTAIFMIEGENAED